MCIINIYKKAQHRQDQTLTVQSPTLPATRSLSAFKMSFVKVCFDHFANFLAFHSMLLETWVQSQVNLFPSGLSGSWLASQWVFIFYFWNFCILLSLSRMKLNSPGCCDNLLPFGVFLWLCAGCLPDLFLAPWLFSAVTRFIWFIPVLHLGDFQSSISSHTSGELGADIGGYSLIDVCPAVRLRLPFLLWAVSLLTEE